MARVRVRAVATAEQHAGVDVHAWRLELAPRASGLSELLRGAPAHSPPFVACLSSACCEKRIVPVVDRTPSSFPLRSRARTASGVVSRYLAALFTLNHPWP